MLKARHLVTIPVSLFSFVYTLYAVGQLMWFLSAPNKTETKHSSLGDFLYDPMKIGPFMSISVDLILVILFMFQHSLMSSQFLKRIWFKIGLWTIERSVYNVATSGMLLELEYISRPLLVERRRGDEYIHLLGICHFAYIAWIVICGGSVLMDWPELLGLSQVYNDINDYLPPMAYNSPNFRRLLYRVRHPSILALTVILWAFNLMSLDRFILASLWSLYMFIAWTTEERDVIHYGTQLEGKKKFFKSLEKRVKSE